MTKSNANPKAAVHPGTGQTAALSQATVIEEGDSPLNPSDRASLIGLIVVVMSIISALVSYLILTGLTTITPRNEVVWRVQERNERRVERVAAEGLEVREQLALGKVLQLNQRGHDL